MSVSLTITKMQNKTTMREDYTSIKWLKWKDRQCWVCPWYVANETLIINSHINWCRQSISQNSIQIHDY